MNISNLWLKNIIHIDRKINELSTMINWLVVYLPLWKIWKSVGIIIPNIWKVIIHSCSLNHQPAIKLSEIFPFNGSWTMILPVNLQLNKVFSNRNIWKAINFMFQPPAPSIFFRGKSPSPHPGCSEGHCRPSCRGMHGPCWRFTSIFWGYHAAPVVTVVFWCVFYNNIIIT